MDDFLNEVMLITGMKPRNLVNLRGCCLCEHQRLLIYEYVEHDDIDQILLGGEHKTSLSWAYDTTFVWVLPVACTICIHWLTRRSFIEILKRATTRLLQILGWPCCFQMNKPI